MSKRLFPARHPSILRQVAQVLGALVVLTIFAAIAPSKAKAATIAGAYDSVVILRSADNKNRFLGSGFVWGDGRWW